MTASADSMQTYREMLKLDPGSRVFALLAEELCAAGMWEEAAEVCKRGLVNHPDHLRSRVLLGWALMEMGEAEESEQVLLPAVDSFRKNSFIFKLLSEYSVFCDDRPRAAEFDGIYNAFLGQAPAPQSVEAPVAKPETKKIEEPAPVPPALEVEAPESPAIPDLEELIEQAAEEPPEPISRVARMEKLLAGLTESIDMRAMAPGTPPPLFCETDKDYLKQVVTAGIEALSPS